MLKNLAKMSRTEKSMSNIIDSFLKRHDLLEENPKWEIKKSNFGGLGVFSTRDIKPGEVVFRDYPIIIGPRASKSTHMCVVCYKQKDLKPCENNCGLYLCLEDCQKTKKHEEECIFLKELKSSKENIEESSIKVFRSLTPFRSLLLKGEDVEVVKNLKAHHVGSHGFEVDLLMNELKFEFDKNQECFMRFVCSVLNTNAFEVIVDNNNTESSIRGLYPLGSLANHSCTPNTMHVFDENQIMVDKAAVFIPKGTEILHSYTRITWGTLNRRLHLIKTKNFFCKCQRCCDSTEFGSFIGSIKCKGCKIGTLVQTDATKINSKWQCDICQKFYVNSEVLNILSLLQSTVAAVDDNFKLLYKYYNESLKNLVVETNQVVIDVKIKMILSLGYNKDYQYNDLSDELLLLKQKFCNDILKELLLLQLGQCKIRGLILYENYKTSVEINRRKLKSIDAESLDNIFEESADILLYDSIAPLEIKIRNNNRNNCKINITEVK